MPLISSLGAASSRGFGEFLTQSSPVYVEDVFGTYLYTGNSTTGGSQTINNGINFSANGGLVWIKARNQSANHILTDTARGAGTGPGSSNTLSTNLQSVEGLGLSYCDYVSAFTTTGFTVTQSNGGGLASTAEKDANTTNFDYSAWSFRKQKKFFDIVTYTGNGAARTISHNLGSVPGMIIVKARSEVGDWYCYHVSVGNTQTWALNQAAGSFTASAWNNTTPTSTVFSLGAYNPVNRSGTTYVAYLFANNAGGFGLSGTDSIVTCGSFVPDVTPITVSLGWEPQFVMYQNITAPGGSSLMFDNMRGLYTPSSSNSVRFNIGSNNNEVNNFNYINITATGFTIPSGLTTGSTYFYLAIRRGPMRTPTSGTSVFDPQKNQPTASGFQNTILTDAAFLKYNGGTQEWYIYDRLRGQYQLLCPSTAAEATSGPYLASFDRMTGFNVAAFGTGAYVSEAFRRAPGFFDIVCYTGTGSARTISHNLGVAPELMIVKSRSVGGTNYNWWVYASPLGNTKALSLNTTDNSQTAGIWNNTTPTASVFSVDGTYLVNGSGTTYVAYLFATCPGVSKVGSYTGTGATQTISCGFTGGARYVLIKRTDSTGDWWVWDTARGMVAGTDPRLAYNSTAAETNANWVYTTTGGFQIVTSDATVNASGGSYIFLAIA